MRIVFHSARSATVAALLTLVCTSSALGPWGLPNAMAADLPSARLPVDLSGAQADASAITTRSTAPRPAYSSTPPRPAHSGPAAMDARLFSDMTPIGGYASTPASTTHVRELPLSTQTPPSPRPAATLPSDAYSGTRAETPTSRATMEAATASTRQATPDRQSDTLFASATIDARPRGGESRLAAPSEAYVPMLPEDFYAPSDVRRDPVASEVGLPDMEPVGDASDGFRYLQRRALPVSAAMPGIVLPYPVTNVFSTYSDCRPGGRTHAGLDVGGVGALGGLGTAVYAMARARVTFVGRPEDDPDKFGQADDGHGHVQRGPRAMELPRSQTLPGYGLVSFFTKTYGSWRTGTIIVMEATEGPLAGHRIRYMHLGAVHPEIRVGDMLEAGQEVGLMGGTAIQHDMPHIHIDIEDAQSRRVDVAPFVGLPGDVGQCRRK